MSRPPLLPGAAPAKLLLDLWEAQARGERVMDIADSPARSRLTLLGFIDSPVWQAGYSLTEAGRQAAAALEGSS